MPRGIILTLSSTQSPKHHDRRIMDLKSSGVIHRKSPKLPESISKSSSIIGHIICALPRTCTSISLGWNEGTNQLTVLRINTFRSSPHTTEIDVDDDTLISEMFPNVAIGIGEICGRDTPSAWIWGSTTSLHSYRNGRPRPLPHPNTIISQLQSYKSTSSRVIRSSEGSVASRDAASCIVVRRVDAGSGKSLASLFSRYVCHITAFRGMQYHLTLRLA